MNAVYDATDEATVDVAMIWEHFAQVASIRTADQVIQRIEETIRGTIVRRPKSGRPRPEMGVDVYSFPVVPYIIFYRIIRRRIRIERILHGHRDIQPPLLSLFVAV